MDYGSIAEYAVKVEALTRYCLSSPLFENCSDPEILADRRWLEELQNQSIGLIEYLTQYSRN